MSAQHPWETIIPALVSGGFGAGLATIVTALIQTWSKKGESRASAADLITDAAGTLAARQGETIARLEARVERQAKAIMALTSALDELLPSLPVTESERARLHKACVTAKLAV